LDEEAFAAASGANTVLHELDLRKTRIRDENACRIFDDLAVNQALKALNVGNINNYPLGMSNIPKLCQVVIPQ
jgi:hypothetical protein